MKKKTIFGLFFALTMFLFINIGTYSAEEVLSETEINKVRENFASLGIDKETGEKLIEKLLRGELLDSQKQGEIEGKNMVFLPNGETNIIEFNDGSRVALKMEEKSSGFTTFDYSKVPIEQNNCKTGTGYSTCVVTVIFWDGVWDLSYDTTVTRSSGEASVSAPRNIKADMVLYNWQTLSSGIVKEWSSGSTPAKTTWKFKASHRLGLATITRNLSVYATFDSTYARLEW